jgi:hypothetical protein
LRDDLIKEKSSRGGRTFFQKGIDSISESEPDFLNGPVASRSGKVDGCPQKIHVVEIEEWNHVGNNEGIEEMKSRWQNVPPIIWKESHQSVIGTDFSIEPFGNVDLLVMRQLA